MRVHSVFDFHTCIYSWTEPSKRTPAVGVRGGSPRVKYNYENYYNKYRNGISHCGVRGKSCSRKNTVAPHGRALDFVATRHETGHFVQWIIRTPCLLQSHGVLGLTGPQACGGAPAKPHAPSPISADLAFYQRFGFPFPVLISD